MWNPNTSQKLMESLSSFSVLLLSATNKTTEIQSHHQKLPGLGLESQGQSNLSALFNCLRINLPRDCEERLGAPLMLDKGTRFPIVVQPSLHCSQGVECMLRANGQCVFIAWKTTGQLCTNGCTGQWSHCVVVGSSKGVSLIIAVVIIKNIPISKGRLQIKNMHKQQK